MPTANASISRELERIGWQVDHLYIEDFPPALGGPRSDHPLLALELAALLPGLESRRGRYDVIQVSGGDGWTAPLLRGGRGLRRRLVVARCHGLEHRYWDAYLAEMRAQHVAVPLRHRMYFGGLRLWQVERTIRGGDLYNCHTTADAEYARQRGWTTADKTCILPSGVEPPPSRQSQARRARSIMWSGTWTWMKGTRVLVEVFERLCSLDAAVCLTLVVPGGDRTSVLQDFRPDVRDRVKFLPGIPHDEFLGHLSESACLLMTSLFEGFGTVVIEAMAGEVPVVASMVGGAPDFIVDGESGYLVPPGDVDATVGALQRLFGATDGARAKIGRAGRDRVASVGWPTVARRTAEAYEGALARVRSN